MRNITMNRRDFLKAAGMVSLAGLGGPLLRYMPAMPGGEGRKPNILMVLFDAFSAHNISLYGYERETTPNLARLAGRAIVYHNHYAGGNFTTPGTASLLTGVHPWRHRAFNISNAPVDFYKDKNIFSSLSGHHRIAYSHNPLAIKVCEQFSSSLDDLSNAMQAARP